MFSKCKVVYYTQGPYENPIRDFLNDLSFLQQSKILRIFQYIEEYGLETAIPHLKKLAGTPFWEIRILGKDNIRLIIVVKNNTVLVLNGFVKKKQKTPNKELKVAFKRYRFYTSF